MKNSDGILAGAGIIGILGFIAMWLFLIGVTIYGLVLAFSASVILGIVVLFVEPAPLLIGLIMLLAHKDLAQMFMDFLNK